MSKHQMRNLRKIAMIYQKIVIKNIVISHNVCLFDSKNSINVCDNTYWNSNDMTSHWAKIVIFHTNTFICCQMAQDDDTEWPNISKYQWRIAA